MKRSLKIISSFMLIFVTIFTFFITNETNVKASYAPIDRSTVILYSVSDSNGAYGTVSITKEGALKIEYKYGFSEFLVVATLCSDYTNTGKEGEKKACNSFVGGKTVVYHASGARYNGTDKDKNGVAITKKSLTIHLFNNFEYDDIVQVKFITSFFNTKAETAYTPLYCNLDLKSCQDNLMGYDKTVNKKDYLSEARVNELKKYLGIQNSQVVYLDNLRLIYSSNGNNRSNLTKDFNKFTYEGEQTDRVYVQIDNSKVVGDSGSIKEMIFDVVVPTLIGILIIVAGVTGAVLGYQIVKSSDEPQERREKVAHLRNILIGVALALLLLFVMEPITIFVEKMLEE